jgi:hypothetical protein
VAKQQKALRKSRRRGETAEQWLNMGYDEKTTFSCGGSTGEKRVKSHAVIKRPLFHVEGPPVKNESKVTQ